MKRSSTSTGADSRQVSCKTKVESTQSVVNWEIEKFSLLCPSVGGLEFDTLDIFSPLQETTLNHCGDENGKSDLRLNWQTQLYSNGSESGNKDFLSTYFHIRNNGNTKSSIHPEMRMILRISVIGANNSALQSRFVRFNNSALKRKDGKPTGYGFPAFIKLEDVWKDGSEYLTNDGSLHLKIDITFAAESPTNNATKKFKSDSSIALLSQQLKNGLSEDMEQLLSSGNNSDLTVNCAGKVFRVHSYVLKARSPVFRAMFESGMKESLNSSIKIDDVDLTDFEAFQEYLYKATLPAAILETIDVDVLIGLVRVADKYQVLKLRDFCFGQLAEHISLERAGEIVVLLSLHSAPEEIRSKCIGNRRVLSNDATLKDYLKSNPTAFLNVWSSLEQSVNSLTPNPGCNLLNVIPKPLQEHSPKAAAASLTENRAVLGGRCLIM